MTKSKFVLGMSVLGLLPLLFFSCSKPDNEEPPMPPAGGIESVSLSVSDTLLTVGETFVLDVVFTPSGIDIDSVDGTWSSQRPSVASVDETGLVTALAEGSTVIKYSIGDTLSAECTVLVQAEVFPDAITLSLELTVLKIGETVDIDVMTEDSYDYTHPDLVWESSDEEVVTVDQDGVATAVAFGSVCVRAMIGSAEAYCYVVVEDSSQPSEYDQTWLRVPYPYLEYPTTYDKVMAAENASTEGLLVLRKFQEEKDGVMSFEIRDYLDHGPVAPMFNNTFYDLDAKAGDRFAWGYCLGISSEDMVDGVMVELMAEQGFTWKKNIDMTDGSHAAWYANEPMNRSALIYVLPYNDDPDRVYGVIEFRVLEDDPMNDGSGPSEGVDLPQRNMDFGATMDDIRAWESSNGGVLNEAWCYSSSNLAYDVPVDKFNTYFVNYVFNDYTGLYWIQLFGKDPYQFFNEDGMTLRSDLVESLKNGGYSDRGDNSWFHPGTGVTVKFVFYDYDVIADDSSYPTFCVEYEI